MSDTVWVRLEEPPSSSREVTTAQMRELGFYSRQFFPAEVLSCSECRSIDRPCYVGCLERLEDGTYLIASNCQGCYARQVYCSMAYAVIRKTAGHWEVKTRRAHTFTPTSAVKEDKKRPADEEAGGVAKKERLSTPTPAKVGNGLPSPATGVKVKTEEGIIVNSDTPPPSSPKVKTEEDIKPVVPDTPTPSSSKVKPSNGADVKPHIGSFMSTETMNGKKSSKGNGHA